MKTLRTLSAIALAAIMTSAFAQSQVVTAPAAKPGPAATAAMPATAILADARAKAKAENKNVLLIFHASWCGWCKRLDKFMSDPQFKPLFDDNFVTVHLTVLEDDQHKADENPGGLEQMDALGGRDAGLPLFGILDADGKILTTSMRPPSSPDDKDKAQNTGFPAAEQEIAHFATMMGKGAKRLLPEELAMMKAYLAYQEAARMAAAAKKKAAAKAPAAGG